MTTTNEATARRVSCTGKTKYETRRMARRVRKRLRNGVLHVYRCGFCGFFHLGHIPAEVAQGAVDKDDWKRRRGL